MTHIQCMSTTIPVLLIIREQEYIKVSIFDGVHDL